MSFPPFEIDGRICYRVVNFQPTVAGPNTTSARRLFERRIVDLLTMLNGNHVGATLLTAIRAAATGRVLEIVPLASGANNAFAMPLARNPHSPWDWLHARQGSTSAGQVVRDTEGNPVTYLTDDPSTAEVERPRQQVLGRGTGSDACLLIEPRSTVRGWPVDLVLCHELVHMLRIVKGRTNATPLGAPWGNQEEFNAILVERMYSSLNGGWMRDAHGPTDNPATVIPRELRAPANQGVLSSAGPISLPVDPFAGLRPSTERRSTPSEEFAVRNESLIRNFVATDHDLCCALSALSCPFNPLRSWGRASPIIP